MSLVGAISDFVIKACVVHTIAATGSRFLDHPRRLSGASGLRLRLCGARQRRRTGPHCCLLDDRQRAWRHLLHLRGELSTALASARLGGEYVAGCADPPSGLKCRMEARRMDRETAESVAGVARLPRRAALLVSVRADQEGPWSPGAVLIIFSLLWMVSREPKLYLCMHRVRG
jgi:hypothetical protein